MDMISSTCWILGQRSIFVAYIWSFHFFCLNGGLSTMCEFEAEILLIFMINTFDLRLFQNIAWINSACLFCRASFAYDKNICEMVCISIFLFKV